MNILKMVADTVHRHDLIQNDESIVVGVSGGPDSVCLLHVLFQLADELHIRSIYAVHINHMIRGREADEDEEYVAELCKSMGVPLYSVSVDVKRISARKGISVEEAGREARYSEFKSFAERVGAEKIAVAHNRNDQAETVILNIIRGTGLEGLKGMEYKRDNIIRPLMDIGRVQIEEYCTANLLNPRTDSTNLKAIYTRNKIRKELIPSIDELFNTDITSGIVKMASLIKDDNNYIEQMALSLYNQCVIKKDLHGVELKISKTMQQHTAVRRRIIRRAIADVKGDLKGIENVHVQQVDNLINNGKTGSRLHLPHKLRIERSYDSVRVFINCDDSKIAEGFSYELVLPGKTSVDARHEYIDAFIFQREDAKKVNLDTDRRPAVQFFDWDRIDGGINIRNRRKGDVFKPLKSNGTKKLKEYFIDNKIPRELRDEIPVIAKEREIVWVIGYKISDKFKVTENTKRILRLEYKKTDGENT
ncbi:tRNA(Ile)-lysidine synthase [Anaerobacterium chartisolvens]|uniref:tRNA(Ile)-lysidine synthase n=2 Tax=Anaerobacterium chartisolvens TaxID=1297424 RepID=A0A369BKN1_9FIRM|nr:tRNA(Ile)-lysidine synthase [Anaerobacterium chartisolvens]